MYLFVIRMVIVCQMEGAPSKFLLIVSNLNTKTTNALKFDVLILGRARMRLAAGELFF